MKHTKIVCALVAIMCMAVLTAAVLASAPKLMSYQGRATDASGIPVTDGPHVVRFDLFNNATTGSSLWNEQTSVTTTGGLFTHTLGSVTPVLESQFRYYEGLWLEVTFDGQVQTPRTQFTSVGYAFHVQSIHNADGGSINGYLAIYDNTAGNEIAELYGDLNGEPVLHLDGSERNIELNTGQASDGSVTLPDSAINSLEIKNEPGIACAIDDQLRTFNSTLATDVLTISLTIPAGGYIFVEAKFKSVATGIGQSFGWIQIDETGGGNYVDPYFSWFGQDTLLSLVEKPACVPGYVSRVYYKSAAGTYTFRLEGGEMAGNCVNCVPQVENSILVATYFPTAYGSVSGVVSGTEAGQFETAAPVQVDGEVRYQVDLRELELRAAKAEAEAERARADAERAQRHLLRAKYESSEGQNR